MTDAHKWSIGEIMQAPIGTMIIQTDDGWRTVEGELLPSGTAARLRDILEEEEAEDEEVASFGGRVARWVDDHWEYNWGGEEPHFVVHDTPDDNDQQLVELNE
jgi:hypothetical protein